MFCQGEEINEVIENQVKIKKIQNYLFKYNDKLGEGNFSKVYSGTQEKTGQLVAVKVIEISSIKSKVLSDLLQNQIELLKHINHPNVIRCYDVLTSINNCYIIAQYCQNGDLEKILRKNKKFNQQDITKFVYDIYQGLVYLAQNDIVHRDLKLANVFLTANNTAKIADFGFAIKSSSTFKDMSIGTPIYMSPQGLIKNEYGPKTDVWSFGVMLYELVHGDTPLSYCRTQKQLKQGVMLPPKFRVQVSSQLKQLIELCMNPSEKMRIHMQQLDRTPYMRRVIQMIEGVNIPKQMLSTNHSSEKTLKVYLPPPLFLSSVLSYQDTVAIIHYCRLIHKTLKTISSMILQQWLITLSSELLRATVDPKCQKALKVTQVIQQYHKKYETQHLVPRNDRNVEQVLYECECLRKSYKNIPQISIITKQTEHFRRYIRSNNKNISFGKNSISESFLSKLK